MSRYNFRPNLTDHAQINLLVTPVPIFRVSEKDLNFVLSKLSPFTHGKVQDDSRNILLKFTTKSNWDVINWGCLQFHRRPLGLIGVARLSADRGIQADEYSKIEHRFSNLISQYESHIFDSRCIVIGPLNPNITMNKKNIFYIAEDESDISEEFISFISDFTTSVFVILESKRFEKMSEDLERMQLPTTQYEPEQTISDSDTRFMKKKCFGRNKKLLGDLCLLAGLYTEALNHYSISLKTLLNVSDYLWVASALEGLCACSLMAILGDSVINANSRKLIVDKPNISANISENIDDEQTFFSLEEIIAAYKESLIYYRRYCSGIVVVESHFKFIRILLKEQKKIECAEVVQHLLVACSYLQLNEIEKIEFFLMLGSIHDQLNLRRKAAFYRRQGALNYLKCSNPSKASLNQALLLFDQVLPGYKLDLSEKTEYAASGHIDGWPAVQSGVLIDMLKISEKLGNKLDVVRLLCLILSRYSKYICSSAHEMLVDLLEEYSDDTKPLLNEYDTGKDVRLIEPLPMIRDFSPKKLAQFLQPRKSQEAVRNNPFIFSSLSIRTRGKDKEDVVWVCDEVCEVAMVVDNPLPAEIKVNKMTLLTEGIPFEAHPATLALPAQSGAFPFMLLGTPKQPGTLIIKGYQVEVLCITNTVLLPKPITVEVIPPLPILKLSSTLPRVSNAFGFEQEDKLQTLYTSANVYHGHSCTGKVMLENAGSVPITKLELLLKKPAERNIVFNESLVQDSLPLPPGETISLNVVIMPEDCWKYYASEEKLEVKVTMKYSYEEGELSNYTREMGWVTNVNIMPSLTFSNFHVFEIVRHPTCCVICFDAVNMTSVSMNVSTRLNIVGHDISGLHCCMEENITELTSKMKTTIQIHFPRLLLTLPSKKGKTIEDVYQEFICNSIGFNWRLSDTNYSGIMYIHGVKVTNEMVPILKPKHLKINVVVNGDQLDDGNCLDADECQLVNVLVSLTNIHDEILENVVLNVNPYQECDRSVEEMNALCLPSGCLLKGINKLFPGETFEHSCGLLFLYHGKYMVDISCFINQNFGKQFSIRDRTYGVAEAASKSLDSLHVRNSFQPALSPGTVNSKLKAHEPDFWGHTFSLNIQ